MHSTVSELVVIKPCHISMGSFCLFIQETKQKYDSKKQVVNSATSAGCRISKNKEMQENLPPI